jgi:hypothetical protein
VDDGDVAAAASLRAMPPRRSIVPLPQGAQPPYRVFLNGVPQEEGRDYRIQSRALVFPKHLQKEGRLGAVRWAGIFLGLFGTYRQNDSVDVQYTLGGETRLATYLDIIHPDEGDRADPA